MKSDLLTEAKSDLADWSDKRGFGNLITWQNLPQAECTQPAVPESC